MSSHFNVAVLVTSVKKVEQRAIPKIMITDVIVPKSTKFWGTVFCFNK